MKNQFFKERSVGLGALRALICCLFFSMGTAAVASEYRDYDFEQERMIVTRDSVLVVSTFDTGDGIAAFSHYGASLWKIYFQSKIISWECMNDLLFVFSKDISGLKTNLTCLDRYTGEVLWNKP